MPDSGAEAVFKRVKRKTEMRLTSYCVACLLNRQQERIAGFTDEEKKTAYMKEVAATMGASEDEDSAPYMVYLFNQIYRKYFGEPTDYTAVKKEYNKYVLEMEERLHEEIMTSSDPLATALVYARIGNYIDFGAMQHVDKEQFLSLFKEDEKNALDMDVYKMFLQDCENGENFLLLADNSGEIVIDKLFIKELQKRFPHLKIKVMVRGGEVLNDATMQDAQEVGLCELVPVVSNGNSVAGTVEKMMPPEAIAELDKADIILSKGQANFETANGCGRNIYYSFLCKCDWFSGRFHVPKYTGMFIREREK